MKNIAIALIAICIFMLSCNQNKNDMYSDSKKIYDESIKMHDEVMPMMGNIMKLQAELKSIKEETTDTVMISTINTTLQNLENAHKSMMYWMHHLTPIPNPDEINSGQSGLPTEKEMLNIQKQSLEKIKKIKQETLESIDKAENLLSDLS